MSHSRLYTTYKKTIIVGYCCSKCHSSIVRTPLIVVNVTNARRSINREINANDAEAAFLKFEHQISNTAGRIATSYSSVIPDAEYSSIEVSGLHDSCPICKNIEPWQGGRCKKDPPKQCYPTVLRDQDDALHWAFSHFDNLYYHVEQQRLNEHAVINAKTDANRLQNRNGSAEIIVGDQSEYDILPLAFGTSHIPHIIRLSGRGFCLGLQLFSSDYRPTIEDNEFRKWLFDAQYIKEQYPSLCLSIEKDKPFFKELLRFGFPILDVFELINKGTILGGQARDNSDPDEKELSGLIVSYSRVLKNHNIYSSLNQNNSENAVVRHANQAASLKHHYKDFDLEKDLEFPLFSKMILTGIPMELVFEILHKEKLFYHIGKNESAVNTSIRSAASVVPVNKFGRLTCPICGSSGMPLNRKRCWQCGAYFSESENIAINLYEDYPSEKLRIIYQNYEKAQKEEMSPRSLQITNEERKSEPVEAVKSCDLGVYERVLAEAPTMSDKTVNQRLDDAIDELASVKTLEEVAIIQAKMKALRKIQATRQ